MGGLLLFPQVVNTEHCKLMFYFDGLMQERCNSSALAMELCLSCTNPSIYLSWKKFREFVCSARLCKFGLWMKQWLFRDHSGYGLGQWEKALHTSGIILVMGSANKRRCYYVTPSLIGRAHTHNDPWFLTHRLLLFILRKTIWWITVYM